MTESQNCLRIMKRAIGRMLRKVLKKGDKGKPLASKQSGVNQTKAINSGIQLKCQPPTEEAPPMRPNGSNLAVVPGNVMPMLFPISGHHHSLHAHIIPPQFAAPPVWQSSSAVCARGTIIRTLSSESVISVFVERLF